MVFKACDMTRERIAMEDRDWGRESGGEGRGGEGWDEGRERRGTSLSIPAHRWWLKESAVGGLHWLLREGGDREGNGQPDTPAPSPKIVAVWVGKPETSSGQSGA